MQGWCAVLVWPRHSRLQGIKKPAVLKLRRSQVALSAELNTAFRQSLANLTVIGAFDDRCGKCADIATTTDVRDNLHAKC